MRVLSLPARHPYMSKFNTGKDIKFVNPDTDFFEGSQKLTEEYLDTHYPPSSYDVVHIHFSYDLLSVQKFEKLLRYFKQHKRPIVWTCHNRKSLIKRDLCNGKYERLLFEYSNKIISPTQGCATWLHQHFGEHKSGIEIIPLGFLADPDLVASLASQVPKDRNLFTILLGDFRGSKEVVSPILNFLHCSALARARLKLIYKPFNLSVGSGINWELIILHFLTQHPRITTFSLPEISNEVIVKAFLESHAIILPYKWGTHSGQIELAKDCGCHIIAPTVGFFYEQWDKICFWNISDGKTEEYPRRYTQSLIAAYRHKSIKPIGKARKREFKHILHKHLKVYREVVKDKRISRP